MEISKICSLINEQLDGELLRQDQLLPLMDAVIDDINAQLNSMYPAFSEYTLEYFPDYPNYNVFPDKYIRTVVVVGAAFNFYMKDEEGNQTAPLFQRKYDTALFYMTRDMMEQVPLKYRGRCQGYVRENVESGSPICMKDILE